MKCIPVITASLLLGYSSIGMAQEVENSEKLLGAIAGGVIGSTIGQGDGRKAATVLGAIIGYRNGEAIFGKSDETYYGENYHDRRRRFERYCYQDLPSQYSYDRDIAKNWIRGCTEKLGRIQRELERQAYLDGLNQ